MLATESMDRIDRYRQEGATFMSTPRPPLNVSVVIITAGRRQCLPPCIESLRRQTYHPLEVVVVVGPSKDGSAGYASTLTDAKVYHVDKLNVAYARNEGVRRCGGEIIAFIDDDAIAHPRWLADLIEVFEREGPSCGGVAGLVVNENFPGRPVQASNNTINDLGEPDEVRLSPVDKNDPEGAEFNYFMGANMAFRREAILAAGGFDETYSYLYEDADMSVSVIKAGYRVLHHPFALVHHLPANSHNRRGRFDLNYFAIARHQLYFALKYSRRTARECLWGVARTKDIWFKIWSMEISGKRMTLRGAARHTVNAARGLASGLKQGLRFRKQGRDRPLSEDLPLADFRPIAPPAVPATPPAPRARQRGLRIALVCGEFGGPVFGGVGGYTRHLAEALASRGNDVTVLRCGHTKSLIPPDGYKVVNVPPHPDMNLYRTRFLTQLVGMARGRGGDFDLVEAPLWNGEGAAFGIAGRWPLVIRLQTPFELTRQLSGVELDPGITSLIAAEQLQLRYASGVISISQAVIETVEQAYAVPLDTYGRRLRVIPLGMPPAARLLRRTVNAPDAGGTRYLFVGRLEARKGVLELGRAFAEVARRDPSASLWIVGADNSVNDGFAARTGGNYRHALESIWGPEIASRVHFFGKLDDAEKNDLFARCDVLVAPSMYESFGLIFVEAMRYGKPTVGTRVGGIPEVVADGETGLLVPVGASEELAGAMLRLGASPELRRDMGARGLRRFEERFSLYSLGRETENFYRQVLDDWHGRSSLVPADRTGGTDSVDEPESVPFRTAAGRSAA